MKTYTLLPTRSRILLAILSLALFLSSGPGSGLTIQLIGADTDLPVIGEIVVPTANAAGWHNTNVAVSFLCKDEISNIVSCTVPMTATLEGANQVVTGTAIDSAGNTASTSATLHIDKTPPTLNPVLDPPANANGWHNRDVTVNFAATDALSGIVAATGPVSVTGAGAAQMISGKAADIAGNNTTTAATVNLDKSAPAITNMQPADGSTLAGPRPTLSASFSDNLASLDQAVVQITLNGADVTAQAQVNTAGFSLVPAQDLAAGGHTLVVMISDRAGNPATATTSFTIQTVDDGLPPDPATIAPPNDLSVATDVVNSTKFSTRAKIRFRLASSPVRSMLSAARCCAAKSSSATAHPSLGSR